MRDGEAFRQEMLPHPSVNLVIEPTGAWIWGVPTARASRVLAEHGWAIGTKFRPGAFTACTGVAASSITNGRISPEASFSDAATVLQLSNTSDVSAVLAAVERLLTPWADVDNPALDLVQTIIGNMGQLPPHARVEDLAASHHLAPRTLQRLFHRYVGVGPKWVLKRLRIHQAIERLTALAPPSWTQFALELGYYDQAHFIRDFSLIAGRTPAAYAAEAANGWRREGH
jgi:AraC-like DNA-binding protein